jgi:hypothetical protein
LWDPAWSEPQVRAAFADASVRRIEHVAPEEIDQAMLQILRPAFSMERTELVQRTARLLGYDRTGNEIQQAISTEADELLTKGVIETRHGRLQAR